MRPQGHERSIGAEAHIYGWRVVGSPGQAPTGAGHDGALLTLAAGFMTLGENGAAARRFNETRSLVNSL